MSLFGKIFKKPKTDAIYKVVSPNGRITITFVLDHGRISYFVEKDDKLILRRSRLGIALFDEAPLGDGMAVVRAYSRTVDNTWEALWGEERLIRNSYNETTIYLEEVVKPARILTLRFRAFNDGVAFRYEIPAQPEMKNLVIEDEITEFNADANCRTWTIPAYQPDRYEYDYKEKALYEIGDCVHTPATFRTPSGDFFAVHEAALYNYGSMTLAPTRNGLKADITPLSDTTRAHVALPFNTPWRILIIGNDALDLTTSRMMLNLNDAPYHDFSWVEPIKFLGIWWAMYVGEWTWAPGDRHGATTEHAKQYIDFCRDLSIRGLLVEGWNNGWEGDWLQNGVNNKFMEATPDFDVDEVSKYARENGVELVGHHETVGFVDNYESQLEDAYKYLHDHGIRYVKSGYAGSRMVINGKREWHHSQLGVLHYQHAVELAAKYGIMIDMHEPIKSTGIERTWPNLMTREGARGQEYEGGALVPSHACFLPYTRLLAGGMDYTSGIFDVCNHTKRIATTITRQIAYFVTIYSSMQMAAERPQFYKDNYPDLFTFIQDVPLRWEVTIPLVGTIGESYVVARKEWNGNNWYVGGVTNEESRKVQIYFDFLDEGANYKAKIYRDADDAHYRENQLAYVIEEKVLRKGDRLDVYMAPGGGFAISIKRY